MVMLPRTSISKACLTNGGLETSPTGEAIPSFTQLYPRQGISQKLPHGVLFENRVKSYMNNNLGYIIPLGIKLGEPNMSHGARSPTEKVISNLPFVIILTPINEKITSIRGQTIQNVYGLPLKEVRTK